jgi:transposase
VIRAGFLDSESRQDLIELTRDGSAAHRLARRANALVLLDDGMSCASVAKVLYLDDDTIRSWHRLYQEDGIDGLASFGYEGSACRLTAEQQARLTAWITEALPRTSREIGAWIARECGLEYEGRSGLIALLHRLGMEHRKPTAISRKLDPAKQAVFIRSYEALLNQLAADEAVMFADAVHPTHAVRAVGCWGPKDIPVAITQSSGRERLNIHFTGLTFQALRLRSPHRLPRSLCHLSCQRRRLPVHRGSGLHLSIPRVKPVGRLRLASRHDRIEFV